MLIHHQSLATTKNPKNPQKTHPRLRQMAPANRSTDLDSTNPTTMSKSSSPTCKPTQTTPSSQLPPSSNWDCEFRKHAKRVTLTTVRSDEILKGVAGMNFRKPSKVQEKTLPL